MSTNVLNFKNPEWYEEEDINMFRDAVHKFYSNEMAPHSEKFRNCLLYTSDAADE